LGRQSLFRNFSGLPFAEFGDKSLPSIGVRHTRDEIIDQGVQLCFREWLFAIIAWIEPGRLRTYLLLFIHFMLQFRAALP